MNLRTSIILTCATILGLLCPKVVADAVYLTSDGADSVIRIGAGGTQSTFIGSGLTNPVGLVFDTTGNLYVSSADGSIKMFPADGGMAVTMASGLNGPTGLAISPGGVLHAAISGDNKIVKIPAPNDVDDFAPLGAGANPQGIAFDGDGNLFVANKGSDSISKVTSGGGVSTFANSMDVTDPVGVLVTGANRIVVVHNEQGGEILEFNANGNGKPKSAAKQLGTPTGITIDSIGNYYVGTTAGVVKKVVGNADSEFATGITGIGQLIARAAQFKLVAFKNEVLSAPVDAKFASLGSPIIGAGGDVVHSAKLLAGVSGVSSANDSGIWKTDVAGVRSLIAREGSAAPDAAGADSAAVFAGLSDPVVNAAGRIAFRGTLRTGVGGVSSANSSGLWAQNGSGLALLARKGDQVPGLDPGAKFSAFQQFSLPDAGGLVFLATVAGTNVTSANNAGLWAVDGGGVLQLVARKGDVISVNGSDKKIKAITLFAATPFSAGQTRSFSTDGALLFRATFTDKSTALVSKDFGTSTLTVVTFKNEVLAIDPIGAKLVNPVTGAINADLSVAFRSTLAGGGVSLSNNQAVYLDKAGVLSQVARKSFIAPDSDGAIFGAFSDPAINDLGEVAFRATLKGTGGVSVSGRALGLWLGEPGALALAVRQGDAPPSVPGTARFTSFAQFCAPAEGGLVFLAKIAGNGITTSNNQGLWQRDAAGSTDLLLRKGDTLEVDGANRKVSSILVFKTSLYCGSQGRNVSPDGAVTLLLKFSDGYQAIFSVTQP
jgi:hypothetical protein